MTLRSRTIRLAHEKPELRDHLLPLLKEAAANEVVLRTQGGGWAIDADRLMQVMTRLGVKPPVREEIARTGMGPPDMIAMIMRELKRYDLGRRAPIRPKKVVSPWESKEKLFALMDTWAEEAASDWMADNPGESIESVARDLGLSFLYRPGVESLMQAAGLNRHQVAEMAADRLVR